MKMTKDFEQFISLSLPYELRVTAWYGKSDLFFKLHPYLDAAIYPADGEHLSIGNFFEENLEDKSGEIMHKPILRPLSDLVNTITHNGEEFIPVEWLEDMYYTLDLHKQVMMLINDTPDWVNQLDFMLVMHLIEWHFDIYDLIGEGLAVNVNDLIVNPYE